MQLRGKVAKTTLEKNRAKSLKLDYQIMYNFDSETEDISDEKKRTQDIPRNKKVKQKYHSLFTPTNVFFSSKITEQKKSQS